MIEFPSTSTLIQREFLGWDRPALPEAARRLAARYRQGQTLDLGQVIVVVPGQRAGRRLQELLAFHADDEELRLTPPEVVTEGQLPEKLYTPKLPFAGDLVQDLAWAQALRDLPVAQRQRIVPHPPADTEALRWLALGQTLRALHRELAADGVDFAAVPRIGPRLPDFQEGERWQALSAVQRRYLEILDQQRLWDIQTARLKAIEFREADTACDIILLGTVDLNNTLRSLLDRVAGHVTAYIVAPAELAGQFDEHGCLVPAAWCQASLGLRDEQLRQVDDADAQAEAVSEWLAEVGGRYRNDQVAIGVPDEALVPQLQRQLEQCGVRGRWVDGVRLAESAPYRLLNAAAQLAGRHRYDDLAGLVRHPDVEDWLLSTRDQAADGESAAGSLPAQLDLFYNTRLPIRIRARQVIPNDRDWPDLKSALQRIETWLQEASASHPLRTWGDLFCRMLGTIYGGRTLVLDTPADDVLHRVLGDLLKVCDQLRALPEVLDQAALSAADAFALAFGPLAAKALPPRADPQAVELLGWLELPLDDSPALIVTSFNEGLVPKADAGDAFLPDRLRRELGLLHNERRYARDAYATEVLCASRQELRVLFARRDSKNDPVQPSRLIFACADEPLVQRAERYFSERPVAAVSRWPLLGPAGEIPGQSLFAVPRPVPRGRPVERIAITEFKDYLAGPYRYYLKHVCKLRTVDDAARELDGSAFGRLVHAVLGTFGKDAAGPRHSKREEDIFAYLAERLDALAAARYGADQHRPAIRLQIEQARHRLRAFAPRQAQCVQDGWLIQHVERDEEEQLIVPFVVDGEAIMLVGRIDRIDVHENRRTIRILDYKVGDRAQDPVKTHHDGKGWIDLQLPLYRHLWRATGLPMPVDCAVELGYFNLPKQREETAFVSADWDGAMLADADVAAQDVIRRLRREVFAPVPGPAPNYDDGLSAICLDKVLRAPAVENGDDGDPA